MSHYYISHSGQQQGPYSIEQILEKVKKSELAVIDYIYDEKASDWVMLMEHKELGARLKDLKPAAPPKPKAPQPEPTPQAQPPVPAGTPEYMTVEWYVLKGENKFGPFAYTDVVKMLQQKVAFEFDFAWNEKMQTWRRIAELEPFTAANIRKLQDTLMPDIAEVFFRRRHRRVSYNGTILVHDNQNVWKGHGMEISAGGAGVVMENSMIVPGQTLYLHFKPCDGVPAFNAVCEVVSKKFEEDVKDRSAPVRYGLKFTSVSANTQKFLQEMSKKTEAA